MRHWLRSGALTIGAALLLVCGLAPNPDPAEAQGVPFTGKHGVGVHGWTTWTRQTSPSTYALPVFNHPIGELSDAEIAAIRQSGMDFVRLTVDPGVFILLQGPNRDDALARLEAAVRRLHRGGLAVLVDMHPVSAVAPFGPTSGRGVQPFERGPGQDASQRYAQATAWLAGHLDHDFAGSARLAFELLNEPDLRCGDPGWTRQAIELHQAVRQAAPHLTLVVGGSCWNAIEGLKALHADDFADSNMIYTFHFYDDHIFTHQGIAHNPTAPDVAEGLVGGLPYPWNARPQSEVMGEISDRASAMAPQLQQAALALAQKYLDHHWDRSKIDAQMDMVTQWAAANHVAPNRILMGEFGVNGRMGHIQGAYDQDRQRWLYDTRSSAEAHGFRWSLWALVGNGTTDRFDLELDRSGRFDPGMLQALGLKPQ
jgi:aryl-phospho-beta-D-glucosidase BglC (GH1 family)